MFICTYCNKTFTAKHCFEYHLNKNVCRKENNVQCNFCKKTFSCKSNLNRHLRKKICTDKTFIIPSQIPPKSLPNPSQIPPKSLPISSHIISSKTYTCTLCKKTFTRKDNLNRHINRCHEGKTKDVEYELKFKKLEDKIAELHNKQHTTIINQNKPQIHNYNQTINIKINNLGHEDVSTITSEEMFNIVNKCYSALKILAKRTHIDIPENRNIYIPSYKDSYALVYNNGHWEYNDLKKVLEEIKNNNIDRINTYYEDHINRYSVSRQSYINKMLDESLKGNVDAKYMKDIKMLFLNNKNILKQNVAS